MTTHLGTSGNGIVPVDFDPISVAVSGEHATMHIIGADNGGRLLDAFVKEHASNYSIAKDLAAGSILGALGSSPPNPYAAHTSSSAVDMTSASGQAPSHTASLLHSPAFDLAPDQPQTLAGVPYQFMHIEADLAGNYISRDHALVDNSLGSSGLLADYFVKHEPTEKSQWQHAAHPPAFHADYPFSVDNFNCEALVADLEEENRLLDVGVAKWVLWMGIANGHANATSGLDGTPMRLASRERILNVHDLLNGLNNVRSCFATAAVTKKPLKVAVFFIVAVTYDRPRTLDHNRRYHKVTAAAKRKSQQDLCAPSWDRALWFIQKTLVMQPLDRPLSSTDSSPVSEAESDSSIGSYQGEFPEGYCFDYNLKCPVSRAEVNHPQTFDPDDDPANWSSVEEDHQRDVEECKTKMKFHHLYTRPAVDDDNDTSWSSADSYRSTTSPSSPSPSPPSPPPQPPSLFETLDTNAAKGDAMEGDLHALIPVTQSPSEEAWRQCCTLLCIDPAAHKEARAYSVKVPGTDNMWVKPSQLWTAYWMLTSRDARGLCGGILADVMGTGKTYICLLVCLLRALIGYNRAEVEREWQLREHEAKRGNHGSGAGVSGVLGSVAPKQHLPKDVVGGDGVNMPCPCGNALGIECYANPGGITRRLADSMSRGASLILVPQTVMDNWVKTIKRVRLMPKYFEPVVFHGNMAKEDTVMAPAPRLKQKLQVEVRPVNGLSKDGLFANDWEPNVLDVAHAYKPSVAKDAFPERFIFLATHMPERLVEFFQVPVPLRRRPGGGGGGGGRERKTVYSCPVGIQLVDEFHKAKPEAVILARHHKHMRTSTGSDDDFDFWAITGTPLPAKLTDLVTATELVQRLQVWEDPASRQYASRVAALEALQAAFEKAVAADGTPEQAAEVRTMAEQFFAVGLVTRHTEDSTFFGQRIFHLQDATAKVVVNQTPEAFREDVAKVAARVADTLKTSMGDASIWEQTVRSSSLFNQMMNLEVLATFPGAARLMLAEPPVLDFGLAAIREKLRQVEDRDVTKVAVFQQHLDAVIEDSPHLQTILATLDEMACDRQKRRLPTAKDGASGEMAGLPLRKKPDAALKKLVVLCPRMGEAVFVFLALRKLRPNMHAVFVHFDLKESKRVALLRDFDRLDHGPGSGTPQVLVGTFRDAGTGNDLKVANYQILTGPLRLRSQQDQAFGRTNREGQTLPLHHRLLVTEDSPVDRIVMATQARRRILSDPFAMGEPLVLADVEQVKKGED